MILYAYIVIAVLAVLWLSSKLLFKNDTLYLDRKRAKTLYSQQYAISAKPDELTSIGNDLVKLREFKSRSSRIYPSDRAQIIAGAIAARESGFDVREGELETQSGKIYKVNLKYSSDELFNRISNHVEQARLAVSGIEPLAFASKGKCNSCPFNRHCKFRAT